MAEKNGLGQLVGQVGGRSVWQVLVLYMGASWGVLEVVDVEGGWKVSGTGLDAEGRLWCGGSSGGGIRAVRLG